MKWYFALNDRSKDYAYLAKAAVRSAAANTSLIPHCLYDGEPDELTSWFERHGVKVIHHRVSFFPALQAHYPPDLLKIAAGAFLRCDIPIIEKEDEYVLYTDCDVIFLQEVAAVDLPKPKFCACSTEQRVDDWSYFNTGTMVMNTRRLREDHDRFSSFIKRSLPVLHNFDQDAFNIVYRRRIEKLDPIYNWKPYWDRSDNARILHFHGPKPREVNALLRDEKIKPIYRWLFYLDPIGFRHALESFASFDKDFTPHFEGYSEVVLPELVRVNKEYQKPLVSILLKQLRHKVAMMKPRYKVARTKLRYKVANTIFDCNVRKK